MQLTGAMLLSLADRMFTTGEVGVVASEHLPGTDYSAVVQKALELPGFSHEPEPKFVTVGFGHETTLGAAGVCWQTRAGVGGWLGTDRVALPFACSTLEVVLGVHFLT